MSVRNATSPDLEWIARIHKARFTTHFLGQFSVPFIRRFYATFLGSCVFLVHEGVGGVDGFVLGGEPENLARCRKKFVRRHLARGIWQALCRPRLYRAGLQRACGLLARRGSPAVSSPGARLLSIAVAPSASGKGVAVRLVQAFEEALRDRAGCYSLSVRKDNPRAIGFYKKLGFHVLCESLHGMCLGKSLGPPQPAGFPESCREVVQTARKAG